MKDINDRKDIETLVNKFYDKVNADDKISHFFNEVVKVDWNLHLPKMYNFWETLLFGKKAFKGNPMLVHVLIAKNEMIEQEHFDQWLSLWQKTIDENFKGERAEMAYQKAQQIAGLMAFKVKQFG
jgi:hemoglobin